MNYLKTHRDPLLEGSKAELAFFSIDLSSSRRFSFSSRCLSKISRILCRDEEPLTGLLISSNAFLEATSAAKRIAKASSLRS